MAIDDIKNLIASDESRNLEQKKTTGGRTERWDACGMCVSQY